MTEKQIRIKLIELGKTQAYLAKKLNRTKQQIYQALKGEQPTLLKRIIHHITYLEEQK